MRSMPSKALLAGALASLAMGANAAQAASVLPPVHHSGKVEYRVGGIGRDEARAIEAEARHWPLTLEFAVKDKRHAVFAADVKVLVRDAKGHTALDLTAPAPFLLAKLSPGPYRIEASFAGSTLHEKAIVKPGRPAKVLLLWPAGTGEPKS